MCMTVAQVPFTACCCSEKSRHSLKSYLELVVAYHLCYPACCLQDTWTCAGQGLHGVCSCDANNASPCNTSVGRVSLLFALIISKGIPKIHFCQDKHMSNQHPCLSVHGLPQRQGKSRLYKSQEVESSGYKQKMSNILLLLRAHSLCSLSW